MMHPSFAVDDAVSLFLAHPVFGVVFFCVLGMLPLFLTLILHGQRTQSFLAQLQRISLPCAFLIVFLGLTVVNPLLLGAGYVREITKLCRVDRSMFGIDTLIVPDPDGNSGMSYRIHGFNLDTHERTFRHLFRSPVSLLGVRNGMLWVGQEQAWLGLDVLSGETRFVVNPKTVLAHRPDFAIGIANLHLITDMVSPVLSVETKDGQVHWLDVETLRDVSPEGGAFSAEWKPCDAVSRLPALSAFASVGKTFLHGEVVAFDGNNGQALIRSYTTTDERGTILSAVSHNKMLFERNMDEFGVRDRYAGPWTRLSHALFDSDTVVVLMGAHIIGLDSLSGNVRWNSLW